MLNRKQLLNTSFAWDNWPSYGIGIYVLFILLVRWTRLLVLKIILCKVKFSNRFIHLILHNSHGKTTTTLLQRSVMHQQHVSLTSGSVKHESCLIHSHKRLGIFFPREFGMSQVLVAHSCNPSYSEGRNQEKIKNKKEFGMYWGKLK
jgi:hypothetical protein